MHTAPVTFSAEAPGHTSQAPGLWPEDPGAGFGRHQPMHCEVSTPRAARTAYGGYMRTRQVTLGATPVCAAFSVREFAAMVRCSRGRSTRLYPPRLRAIYDVILAGGLNRPLRFFACHSALRRQFPTDRCEFPRDSGQSPAPFGRREASTAVRAERPHRRAPA